MNAPPECPHDPIRIIVASASPRRHQLAELLGLPVTILPSRYEEPSPPNEAVDLAAFVLSMAENKAREVARRSVPGIVLGADTLVTLERGSFGTALGKPIDAEDARRMLRLLSGRTHLVYTGVVLLHVRPNGEISPCGRDAVATEVRFRELTETMIADYVATGEPMDKAGAYGAQGYAAPFIEGFVGDFFNVVGLPICTVGRLLESCVPDWWHRRRHMPPVSG